jgi:hypothetical protein
MKMKILFLIFLSGLSASCAPDEPVADLYSPNRKYHVQIRNCPTGFGSRDGEAVFSVLISGKSENCGDDINSIAQFPFRMGDMPEIEWISDTQLRFWDPNFEKFHMPARYSYNEKSSIKIIFSPK